ncbi:MAG: amino acid ABC transporter ATP-binding protein [Clostridiales Family XIII bacterium]|jgi:polar amino acid transport system ATP-binding protein|nr:amino acid ABC transporter ATP-binding protein [Clostridiales Family XIII bacterium]
MNGMAKSVPVLRLSNIKKRFGAHEVLKGVSLEVGEHEVVVMIGASGSGKSTLIRTINLLEHIDDGQIFLCGEDISNPRVDEDLTRAKIGIVFQQFNLFPHKTVLENVSIANRIVRGMSREEAERIGLDLLDRIGVADKARKYPDQLSGGQQQRVAIVRAIAGNPILLLLDEITSALDPQLVGEVLDLVRELKTAGQAILMATHEMDFARRVADRIVFLHEGQIVEDGSPEQIFEDPHNDATREFLSRIYRA